MTLLETVIAMAIMAIIFAALLPQLRFINNSWDSKVGASETLQNGRVLIDHINRNLSKASRITAVSDSSETNGYIEFIDNDANNVRYDVNSTTDYVEFGLIGNPSDLAGPVSQLQFTCYDAYYLDTPITDVNSIRFVKVQTTVTNSANLDQDMTFSTQAYIRTNALPAAWGGISKLSEPWLEFDTSNGMEPALCQIDQTHYLCAYRGYGDDGFAVVLTVNTDTWQVSKGVACEYDKKQGITPALSKIDQTHYLCAYQGDGGGGYAVPLVVDTGDWLVVDTGDWSIYTEDPLEFDTNICKTPSLTKIDQTHYLCAYQGEDDDGWVRIFKVNTGSWTISEEDHFEFDQYTGETPALIQIDQTHYLCAYTGPLGDGWAVVLSITAPLFDAISMETPFEFDTITGGTPALCQIDASHYLCAYTGLAVDGFTVVLTINTGNWTISKETPFEYDITNGEVPALYRIDDTHYLCAYGGLASNGWVNILKVDTGNWTITEEYDFEFDPVTGQAPALAQIDQTHYLCAYSGLGDDGYAGVLEVSKEIRP